MIKFVWLFLFLLIPVIVHLFNFRRARKFFFTNVRFIQQVTSDSKSKTRLKHILILSSRLFLFTFLIISFLFATFPTNEMSEDGKDPDYFFYLDNSISNLKIGDWSGSEIARQIVEALEFQEGFFLTNSFLPFANNERPKDEILRQIEEVNVSYVSRSFSEVKQRYSNRNYGFFYMVSDFQEFSISDMEYIASDTLNEYYLVINPISSYNNVYLDTIWVSRDLTDYRKNTITCFLNTDQFGDGSVVVKLLDDKNNQLSSAVANNSNDFKVRFSVNREKEDSRYLLRFSGDDLSYDNEFYFTLYANRIPKVFILGESPNRYLRSVFANESLFDLKILDPDEIDYEMIRQADFVVLNEFYRLPQGLISQSNGDVSFFVIPGESIDIENYSSETGISLEENEFDEKLELIYEGEDLLNGVFQNSKSNVLLPKGVSKYKISNTYVPILKLRNNAPYLSMPMGSSLYFLSSPLDDMYTGLPTHSIFLPLMYRLAELSVSVDMDLAVYPNDFLVIEQNIADIPPLIISDKNEVVPEFSNAETTGIIRIPDDLSPGFYDVLIGKDTVRSFAVNLPRSESRFGEFDYQKIKAYFKDVAHIEVVNGSQIDPGAMYAKTSGDGLWKYALVLAMVFLTTEIFLHRYLK